MFLVFTRSSYDNDNVASTSLIRTALERPDDLATLRQPVSSRGRLVGAGEDRLGHGDEHGAGLLVYADAAVPAHRRRRSRPLPASAGDDRLRPAARPGDTRSRGARLRPLARNLAYLRGEHRVRLRLILLRAGLRRDHSGDHAAR